MSLRLAISGYGEVAALHARQLRECQGAALAAVYGPNAEKARAFAAAHGIDTAVDSLDAALEAADALMVCSPSGLHAEQAARALEAGRHTLVELPACGSVAEAERLAEVAQRRGLVLQCAHTSRYLPPYQRLTGLLHEGILGPIQQLRYVRQIAPRGRSWVDDALLHHAEHPLDLFQRWFGSVRPRGCAAHPQVERCQNLALVGELEDGAPVTVSISYTARLARVELAAIGRDHTIETDGFGFLRSDLPELCLDYDPEQSYERAIRDQDAAFVQCCLEGDGGVPWEDTVKLTRLMEAFRKLCRSSLEGGL
jgi:predicted dehydrogenase